MLLACITEPTIETALAAIDISRLFVDGYELRLDYLGERDLDRISMIVRVVDLPLVFTFRKEAQGGVRKLPEAERLQKIENLLELGPAYCDLEADTDPAFIARIAKKFPKVKLIGSYHDFEKTPEDLEGVIKSLKNPHFSVYKIACKAKSSVDLLRFLVFCKKKASEMPLSFISMGEIGKPSRVLAKILGSAIDYAGIESEEEVLHRYSLSVLQGAFNYSLLNMDTRIYALIGNPVEQSPGHLYHNEAFKKKGRNCVYVKLLVPKEELDQFYSLLKQLPFGGLSVTIPLKEAILPLLDRIEPEAAAIGAVNTVTIRDGISTGANVDGLGALDAIEKHLRVKGKNVAILGAGGSAKSIAFEAKRRGAEVHIYNRTVKAAEELAVRLGCYGHGLKELSTYDILINTTPPIKGDEIFIPLSLLRPSTYVMDIVYYPKETPLLHAAKLHGCHCIYGDEMFYAQAALQQEKWS